jgi:N-methylhydantoinase A
MELEAIAARRRRYRCSIDMRHRGQIHEVEVAWPEACTRSNGMPSNANGTQAIEALTAAFYSRYEAIYGKGAAYRDARLEIVNFRVRAMADTRRPRLAQVTPETALRTPPPTAVHFREVYWDGKGGLMPTPIYNGAMLRPGHVIEGPAVVETTDTTVVVRHGQLLQVDTWGNLALHFGHVGSGHGSLAAMPAPA